VLQAGCTEKRGAQVVQVWMGCVGMEGLLGFTVKMGRAGRPEVLREADANAQSAERPERAAARGGGG
jgi:hypothetical protein